MTEEATMAFIRGEHERLYNDALEVSATLGNKADESALSPLVKSVDALFAKMNVFSRSTDSFDDYRWLTTAARQWHALFALRLNSPHTFALDQPARIPLPPVPQGRAYSRQELLDWVATIAQSISLSRLATLRLAGIEKAGNARREMARDYCHAETAVVSRILDGKINFVSRVSADCYDLLAGEWVKYMKCLAAYYRWQQRGRIPFGDHERDYFDASNEMRSLLSNRVIKARAGEFAEASSYLERHYLASDGCLDPWKWEAVEELTRRKADRIWGTTANADELKNWRIAETYVRLFYNNIVAAATRHDIASTINVLRALQLGTPPVGYSIINCLELALCIYFLDPELIALVCSESEEWDSESIEPEIQLKVPARVAVRITPPTPSPLSCRIPLQFRDGFVSFTGEMSEQQREDLKSRWPDKELTDAIDILHTISRYIRWNTLL